VLPRRTADSWIEIGQTLEVEGYAERQRWLAIVAARPLNDRAFLHPANVAELAGIAGETGAEVLRGPLRYPSETGGWQLGDLDLSEYLSKYRDCEPAASALSASSSWRRPPGSSSRSKTERRCFERWTRFWRGGTRSDAPQGRVLVRHRDAGKRRGSDAGDGGGIVT
jgi:hypothetical protein